MLRIVSSNNVEVFRHLGAAPFRRLIVEHEVASTSAELEELVRRLRPSLLLLDTTLPDGSGYELCRRIKDARDLGSIHVILLLSHVISRAELVRIASSGCDDVLALPIHSDDFYQHVAHIANLPYRSTARVACTLELAVGTEGETVAGGIVNASAGGIGIELNRPLPLGADVSVRLRGDGRLLPEFRAKVAWSTTVRSGLYGAGLTMPDDLPVGVRMLLETMALYEVAAGEGDAAGGVSVMVQGDFTETTDFTSLAQRLADASIIDFNLSAVRYISSAGVKAWCHLVEGLAGKRFWFRRCSLSFSSQAAMVPSVLGEGTVRSLEAPYHCDRCDRDELRLLETGSIALDGDSVIPPQVHCSQCGGDLEFDDVPNRYFAFLRGGSPGPDGRRRSAPITSSGRTR